MKSQRFLTLDSNTTDMFKAQKGSKDKDFYIFVYVCIFMYL